MTFEENVHFLVPDPILTSVKNIFLTSTLHLVKMVKVQITMLTLLQVKSHNHLDNKIVLLQCPVSCNVANNCTDTFIFDYDSKDCI